MESLTAPHLHYTWPHADCLEKSGAYEVFLELDAFCACLGSTLKQYCACQRLPLATGALCYLAREAQCILLELLLL